MLDRFFSSFLLQIKPRVVSADVCDARKRLIVHHLIPMRLFVQPGAS